ncbi:MAG: hypothetical protein V3W18_05215 [candidate division Zixibacteria bacterium]
MGWEELLIELLKTIWKSDLRKKLYPRTIFLNYDIKWLIDQYSDEIVLDSLIPYSEIVRWLGLTKDATNKKISEIKIRASEEKFCLSADNSDLRAFQGEALAKMKEKGKMTSNENIVHLENVEVRKEETILFIESACYADQAQSNLVMDWEGPHTLSRIANVNTLRAYLKSRYINSLPSLNEHILANTIGIAAIILYRDGRHLVPYLPQRVGNSFKDLFKETGRTPKGVAVFEGGYHCTASGATQWRHGSTLEEIFTNDMHNELKEEVGIRKEHIEILIPVAFCREFLRGGKPQIFYVGITDRSRDELDELRTEAIETTLASKMVPEIHDEVRDYGTEDELYNKLKLKGITIEACANLHYVEDFVKVFG